MFISAFIFLKFIKKRAKCEYVTVVMDTQSLKYTLCIIISYKKSLIVKLDAGDIDGTIVWWLVNEMTIRIQNSSLDR